MTTIFVTAKINDDETGELIEKVEFLVIAPQDVETMDDLSKTQIDMIEEEIEERREYERRDGDIYRVDIVVLADGEEKDELAHCEGMRSAYIFRPAGDDQEEE